MARLGGFERSERSGREILKENGQKWGKEKADEDDDNNIQITTR